MNLYYLLRLQTTIVFKNLLITQLYAILNYFSIPQQQLSNIPTMSFSNSLDDLITCLQELRTQQSSLAELSQVVEERLNEMRSYSIENDEDILHTPTVSNNFHSSPESEDESSSLSDCFISDENNNLHAEMNAESEYDLGDEPFLDNYPDSEGRLINDAGRVRIHQKFAHEGYMGYAPPSESIVPFRYLECNCRYHSLPECILNSSPPFKSF